MELFDILMGVIVGWYLLALILNAVVPVISRRLHVGDWSTRGCDLHRPQWCAWIYGSFVIAAPFMGFVLLFAK